MDHMNMDSMPLMPGMLTPQQMKALEQATGPAFDHLFLTGMIQHHTGALVMVQDLFNTPGAGQDAVLFDFATDVDNTQRAEINIMQRHAPQGEEMIEERASRLSRVADSRRLRCLLFSRCSARVKAALLLGTSVGSFQSARVIRRSAGGAQGRIVRRRRSDLRTGEGCLHSQATRLRPRQFHSKRCSAAAARAAGAR